MSDKRRSCTQSWDWNLSIKHLRMQSLKVVESEFLHRLTAGDDTIRVAIQNFQTLKIRASKLPTNRGRV